jgi:hypothetical protein
MSSIYIAHFVPIHLQTWPAQAILVSDWSISNEKLTIEGRLVPSDGKSSHCLWQGTNT